LSKVKIRIGKPFYAKDVLSNGGTGEAMTDEKRYEIVTSYLKARVAEMIDEMRA